MTDILEEAQQYSWKGRRNEQLFQFHFTDSEKHVINGVYVNPVYEVTKRKSFPSQQSVIEAWKSMQFPGHNIHKPKRFGVLEKEPYAELYSSSNFEARQYVSGHGIVFHYGVISDIRTRNGLYIVNEDDWASGFAYESHVSHKERDATLPLTRMSNMEGFNRGSMFDIVSVHTDTRLDGINTGDRLVKFADGRGVLIFRDSSSHEDALCFLEVSNEEIRGKHSVNELKKEVLTPAPVRAAEAMGMQIVPTDRMVAWKDNHEPGTVIQRQGEWFFIPEPDFSPKAEVHNILSVGVTNRGFHTNRFAEKNNPLESHLPRDLTLDIPTECECGASSFLWDELIECEECGKVYGEHYVRGTVRHSRNEHFMSRLGETWHRAVTHNRDVWVEEHPRRNSRSGGWD